MSLLRDGTVLRRYHNHYSTDNALSEDLSGREVAPIENVTRVVEGLSTTITFTFKAVDGEEAQPSYPSKTGYRILVAEDNLVNQRLLGKILDKFGQDYVMTRNGQEVVEVYKSNPGSFPCIFMDLAMPVMGGREATDLIRAFESSQPSHRRALIVGMTAHQIIPPNTAINSFPNADFLLRKPVRLHELYDLFLGGPETNVAMLYGSLTEEEKSAYPRLVERDVTLGDDPRSNAIRNELERMKCDYVDSRGVVVRFFSKIIVKVVAARVEAGEDEQSLGVEN
ncbi:CheY-like superfamily [Xylaria digitata]|nr:CheY-like superfamily [Xylaria digitata]